MPILLFLIALILGIFFYSFEVKLTRKNDKILQESARKIAFSSASAEEYKQQLQSFLERSHFELLIFDSEVYATHKPFSIGWLLIGIAFVGIGALFYIAYYLFRQKPRRITLPPLECYGASSFSYRL
ncbi:MAG: hypothetical protein ACTTH5_00965 [Wolinella sp.]